MRARPERRRLALKNLAAKIDVRQVGEQAARLPVEKIDRPDAAPVIVELTPRPTVRGATAAPRELSTTGFH